MQFRLLARSWSAMRSELVFYRVLVLALLVVCAMALFGWLRKDQSTIIAPPTITEQMEVSRNKASSGYKKAWGLFTSTLIGNLTPSNADFVLRSLEDLFAPAVYGDLRRRLAADLETLKKEQVTVSFEPQLVSYEPGTDKVFVVGRSSLEGVGGKVDRFQRTYEYCIAQNAGRPVITRFRTYTGDPRTIAYWSGRGKLDDDEAKPCTGTTLRANAPQNAPQDDARGDAAPASPSLPADPAKTSQTEQEAKQ